MFRNNNIPIEEETEDEMETSIQHANIIFANREKLLSRHIKTLHFLNQQSKIEKRQAREAAAEQAKMDDLMRSKEIVELENRIKSLEKTIKKD